MMLRVSIENGKEEVLMALEKQYQPGIVEPKLQNYWESQSLYEFKPDSQAPVFSIDTPPPTVSGFLHLGHAYSYSHTDFIARYKRMCGFNVFYPMGYDDNGLPTERLVEKRYGITAEEAGRERFIEQCLKISAEIEKDYEQLWKRLGLSIDWRYTYRTIDENSRRIAQKSFIDLYRKEYVHRSEAPAIWCPECRTTLAQADMNDMERETEFVTLHFQVPGGQTIPIATTRPELLAACTAVFVHPDDPRYRGFIGKSAIVPIIERQVPVLADAAADPAKGSGAVMCCTFGDQVDVSWWRAYGLPVYPVIAEDGTLTALAGKYGGLTTREAQTAIKKDLDALGVLSERTPTSQTVRVHERCDTPVEYIIKKQWFVGVLGHRQELLEAGGKVRWHPAHMENRYRSWVENLNWDWNISRQRYFGIPFPAWFCEQCDEVILAEDEQLPVDPSVSPPPAACPRCGSREYRPEIDVMDTWATSSMSPQIVARWLQEPSLYARVFPMDMRPQGQDIIRTWAFYTLVKSVYHFGEIPWRDIALSGWGIAAEGEGKISKSRGGGPMPPREMIEKYSADAVRYWASSTGPGKDAIISEEKIQLGQKLVIKLWNVARFAERFIRNGADERDAHVTNLSAADRWILSELQSTIQRVTSLLDDYEYANAKSEVEAFFWKDLADNYLEMVKQRLYAPENPGYRSAVFCLRYVLLATIKLFAPFIPYVTEQIFRELFAESEHQTSIHRSAWPVPAAEYQDQQALEIGALLVEIATLTRRYKSERNQGPGTPLSRLQVTSSNADLLDQLRQAASDLASITRADQIDFSTQTDPSLTVLVQGELFDLAVSAE
jgi:valyl-tRNA synthetase